MSLAPALENGLRILEYIADQGETGFNQLKQSLDIPPASLNRYLKVLADREFIEKNEQQQYVPGAKLRALGQTAGADPYELIVGPVLELIRSRTGHSAIWIDWVNGRMRCRDKRVAPEGVGMQEIGELRTDYAVQPWGYLFLGDADAARRALLLESGQLGPFRGRRPEPEQIVREIERAAGEGYSDDRGTLYRNVRRIAVPIRAGGRFRAAIGVGMAGTEYPQAQINEVVALLKEQAARVESLVP